MKRWDRHKLYRGRNIKKAWKQKNEGQEAYRCPETIDIEDLIAAKKKEQDNA
jgi:hypothetical protein